MNGITNTISAQIKQLQIQTPFNAKLFGNNEVPPVTTSATGMAQFKLSTDGKTLSYTLTANNIKDITASHIHQGKTGENGQPVVPLSVGRGTITSSNLQGPMAGKQISDLVNLMKSRQAYLNIHTTQNKNGEIRGQILPVPGDKNYNPG
jgi:CHASE2 domain-containing sensor protein